MKLLTSSEEESGNDGAGGSNGQFSGTSKLESCVCSVVCNAGAEAVALGPPDIDFIANLGTGIGGNVLELVGLLGIGFGGCEAPICEGVGGGGGCAIFTIIWGGSGDRNSGCEGYHSIGGGSAEQISDTFLGGSPADTSKLSGGAGGG